jgi:hypothetical protein
MEGFGLACRFQITTECEALGKELRRKEGRKEGIGKLSKYGKVK